MKKNHSLALLLLLFCFSSFSQSLLLKISGNGLKHPSYLLGTMHVIHADSIPLLQRAIAILPQCKTYAMEIKVDNPTAILGMLDQMKIPDNKGLRDYLSKEEYASLSELFLEKRKVSLDLFDRFQPFFIEALMELGESSLDSIEAVMMEAELEKVAKKKKLHIEGLETASQQLASLTKLSMESQIKSLKELIASPDSTQTVELTNLYLQNDAELIYSWLIRTMSAEEKQFLLFERNERMCAHLIDLMKKKPTLAAIGAGHIGGESGVLALLRKKGYLIEDVQL